MSDLLHHALRNTHGSLILTLKVMKCNREKLLEKGRRESALIYSVNGCLASQGNGPKFDIAMAQLEASLGTRPWWTPRGPVEIP